MLAPTRTSSQLDLSTPLVLMAAGGVLIVILFGFYIDATALTSLIQPLVEHHLVDPLDSARGLEPWHLWELGAVTWSLLFGIYYYVRLPLIASGQVIKTLCAMVIFGTIVPNAVAAYLILNRSPAQTHVTAVLLAGCFFTLADLLIYWKHSDPRERGSFFEGFLLADIPTVVGFVVLLSFLSFHHGDPKMEPFAGGAITFQLVASNVIFLLSQAGCIRWVWERHVPQYLAPGSSLAGGAANPWVGAALASCLVVPVTLVLRYLHGARSFWFVMAALAVSMTTLAVGLGGRRSAKVGGRPAGRSANAALVVGAVGLMAFAVPSRKSELRRLPIGETEPVSALALAEDGSTLVRASECPGQTGESCESLAAIGTRKGNRLWPVKGDPTLAVAISSDGKWVATGERDLRATVREALTGKLVQQPLAKSHWPPAGAYTPLLRDVRAVALAPPGGDLLAVGVDRFVGLVDVATGKDTWSKAWHSDAVRALAFSADGHWLVSCADDDGVALWEVRRQPTSLEWQAEGRNARGTVLAVAVSPGGAFAAGLADGKVVVWRPPSDQPVLSLQRQGPHGAVRALRFLAGDPNTLAAAEDNQGVFWWDLGSRRATLKLDAREPASAMSLARDGKTLASGSSDRSLAVWRAE